MKAFREGDVYIDYPFDDAKFRYEHATSKVFCRFTGRDEVVVGFENDLFRDAMRSGTQVGREDYFA